VEPIWKKHWPATVDEKSIRLPEELLPATLARQAKRVPDRPAIHFYGRAITFVELDAAVGRFAGFLQGRGIRRATAWRSSWRTLPSSPLRTTALCARAASSWR
jgi:acyl-CoA synthetase (AMP-forming)/AMP-acid ligase II